MTYGITFTDSKMTKSAELCVRSMLNNNVDIAKVFGPKEISESFVRMNDDIFRAERGCGYWLWKPYIIYLSLLQLSDDEVLIYADAGVEFLNNVNYIIERMDQDIFLFGNMWNHVHWCKADAIWDIDPHCDSADASYRDRKQCQASVIFVRNSPKARQFIKEWLLWCQMPGLIDDKPSKKHNWEGFQDHRHDQAILTTLAIRDHIQRHWWPASYNNGAFVYDKEGYESDSYPVMFNHHRLRNDEYK